MASTAYDSQRLEQLRTWRLIAGVQAALQVFLCILFGLLGTTPWFSIVWGPLALIATGILTHFIKKEKGKLKAERLASQKIQQYNQRISELLTSSQAAKTLRYQALASAGVIVASSTDKDPFGIAIHLWDTLPENEWSILDSYFKNTEKVAAYIKNPTVTPEEIEKAKEFFDESAAIAFRSLNLLRQHHANELEDLIWSSRMDAAAIVDQQ